MPTQVKIYFPLYDSKTDQYHVHYEIREGSRTIDSGKLPEPHNQLRQAQWEVYRLNGVTDGR